MQTVLWIEVTVGVSIALQIAAVVLALRLIPITGKRFSWLVISGAIALMALRRSITLAQLMTTPAPAEYNVPSELVALIVSALMALGLFLIAPLFQTIQDSERRTARANRALQVLGQTNNAIVRAESIPQLLDQMCRLAVEIGGYRFAWIGLVEADEPDIIQPAAEAGRGAGYLKTVEFRWDESADESGPTGFALRAGRPSVSRDLSIDGQDGPWKVEAIKRGFRSVAALPLVVEGEPFGALTVYAGEKDAFEPDEVRLLSTLSVDLSHGIETLRTRLAHELTVREVDRLQGFNESIVDNMVAGIAVQDADLSFEYFNPAAAQLLGYEPSELIGQSWTKIVPEDQHEIVHQADERRARGESDQYELELIAKDGQRVTVLVSGRSRVHGSGFAGTVVVFTDITERVQAEQQVRLQAAALDASADAMVLTNREGTIEWVNPAWTELTGYSAEEALGQNPRLLKSGAQDAAFYKGLWDTILDGRVWRGEVINKRKDGSFYTESETITPLASADGTITHFIAVKRDISLRKENEARIQQQLSQLNALREIDLAITSSLDPRVTFNVLLAHVTRQLQIDAADILTMDSHSQTLVFSAGRGFRTDALRHTRLRLGEGLAGKSALERKIISLDDIREGSPSLHQSPQLAEEGFATYFAVPLIAKGKIQGVLEIFHRQRLTPGKPWMDFLEALASQAAIAIDNAMLFDGLDQANSELVQAYDSTLEGWARALELRDFETEGHSARVTKQAVQLALKMGMGEADLVHLRRGALLHDIGKMGVPDSILHKHGPLTETEWEIMRQHPRYAYEMLAPISYLRPALDIPYCHHEKWDGTGYPRRLKRDEIPLAARVFAIVDVYDALLSDRPYRRAWSEEQAQGYLREQKGRHFDPVVVDAFFDLLNEM